MSFLVSYYIYLKEFIRQVVEFFWIIVYYYSRSRNYLRDDIFLRSYYLIRSSYHVSKLLGARGEGSLLFGNTPIPLMAKIAKAANITSEDHVTDLGCGTGSACFWLAHFAGARATGYDTNPIFIRNAQTVAYHSKMRKRLNFFCRDFRSAPFSSFSVVYFYSTSFDDAFLSNFFPELLRQLPIGARIITVSFPVSEYLLPEYQDIVCIDRIMLENYPWGRTQLFIQTLKSPYTNHSGSQNLAHSLSDC